MEVQTSGVVGKPTKQIKLFQYSDCLASLHKCIARVFCVREVQPHLLIVTLYYLFTRRDTFSALSVIPNRFCATL